MKQPRNEGVVLYVTGGNAATYADANGSHAAGTNLDATHWRRSRSVYVGRGERLALTVYGVLQAGQSVKLRLERLYADPVGNGLAPVTSGVAWPWSPVAAQRLDGTAAASAEVTVLAADLVGVDSAARAVSVGTPNLGPSGSFSVIVQAGIAAAVTDNVVVAVEVM